MIGIIGGSGVYEITSKADNVEKKIVNTDYGDVEVSILDIFEKKVAFIPRHASGHSIPPHKISNRFSIHFSLNNQPFLPPMARSKLMRFLSIRMPISKA